LKLANRAQLDFTEVALILRISTDEGYMGKDELLQAFDVEVKLTSVVMQVVTKR
jgi:hypothetical protein